MCLGKRHSYARYTSVTGGSRSNGRAAIIISILNWAPVRAGRNDQPSDGRSARRCSR